MKLETSPVSYEVVDGGNRTSYGSFAEAMSLAVGLWALNPKASLRIEKVSILAWVFEESDAANISKLLGATQG